jgi:hypothetical protein
MLKIQTSIHIGIGFFLFNFRIDYKINLIQKKRLQ